MAKNASVSVVCLSAVSNVTGAAAGDCSALIGGLHQALTKIFVSPPPLKSKFRHWVHGKSIVDNAKNPAGRKPRHSGSVHGKSVLDQANNPAGRRQRRSGSVDR